MHPLIVQYITAERTRDIAERAERRRDARIAAAAARPRRAPKIAGSVLRLLPVRRGVPAVHLGSVSVG